MGSRVISCVALVALGQLSSGCGGGSVETPGDTMGTTDGAAGAASDAPLTGDMTPDDMLVSPTCAEPAPGAAPLRRLSNAEYRNTVLDLLNGVPDVGNALASASETFAQEPESLGFRNNAEFLGVSSLIAVGYMDAAEAMAPLVANTASLVGCNTEDLSCATQFAESFGKRAFRRPLQTDEVARYLALFGKAEEQGYDFKTGIEWMVFAMLQSTEFLYRVELGAPKGSSYAPSAYETANRLSYLIWQSMPDETLFDAAEQGRLSEPQEVEAQARRMLKDPKANRLLEYFDQWLDLDHFSAFDRDPNVYPDLPENLPELLAAETHAFVSSLLASPSGSLSELLTAEYSYMNADLARHYGVSGPVGADFVRVEVPGRAGILTQGMLLSRDKPTRTSIVRRGMKLRIDVLCQNVPAPPNDVPLNLEALGSELTQRDRLEQHRADPSCAGCHVLMDPIGLVFEGFDAVGRPRTVDEAGKAIDTTSVISATRDIDGPVSNALELATRLAGSEEVNDCYVTQAFRFFYGRDYTTADQCSMAKLLVAFRDSEQSLSELIVALTQTDQFLFRPAPEAP